MITPPTNPYIVPAATVFASVFTGTIAARITARYALNRFKEERAFDRRVEWYGQVSRTVQQIRTIAFEVMTTLSKMPEKRYVELSKQVAVLAREFEQLGGERSVYASNEVAKQMGLRALAIMQLTSSIPAHKGGRGTNGFWEGQHTEWCQLHDLITSELRDELSPARRRTKWLRRLRLARNERGVTPGGKNRITVRARLTGALTRLRKDTPSAETPHAQQLPQALAQEDAGQEAAHGAAFETLWTCLRMREQYEERGDAHRARVLRIAGEAVFRAMDMTGLIDLLEGLEKRNDKVAGWNRQLLRRVLGLMVLENCATFTRLLDSDLRTSTTELGGSGAAATLDALLADLAAFQREYTFKLQRMRNTVVSQAHTSVDGHLQTIADLSKHETRLLTMWSIEWYTRIVQLFITVVGSQPEK